jgi:CDP-glucose 4,6-dehydratase
MFTPTSFWKGRKVLVTGASGLLGSWMVPALAARGANVLALMHWETDNTPWEDLWPARVETIYGDVTDFDLLRLAVDDYAIDTTFHLAAQSLVGEAARDPAATLDVNIRGTWTILEASRATRRCQVVLASSGNAYGEHPIVPYDERLPLQGRQPYDVSKSCADLIAAMYANAYRLPVAIARCGNLFGGGDLNFSRAIPGVIHAALRNESFSIRSDGKSVRAYLYIEDAVEAYLLLAERLASDCSLYGEAFNFSTAERMTVLEVVELVLSLMGCAGLRPVIHGTASGELREQYLNPEKAARILQWRPRYGMEQGLRKSIAWYRKHLSLLNTEPAPAAAAS